MGAATFVTCKKWVIAEILVRSWGELSKRKVQIYFIRNVASFPAYL
jgi:hypothetical protein